MKTIALNNKNLLLVVTFLCSIFLSYGQILTFEFNGLTGDEVSANSNFNNPNLTASTITRGSGLTATANADRFNATNWALTSIANAVTGNDYMEFTVTPNAGFQFDVSTIVINIQRAQPGGLLGISLRSSWDSYATDIDGVRPIATNNNVQVFTFNVNQINSPTPVTYRFYGYASNTTGNGGFEGSGNDIIINGSTSLAAACPTSTTWDGTDWTPAAGPNNSTEVIIDGLYDTATQVSFEACSLTITPNGSLRISNGDYVSVVNDIIIDVDGELLVRDKGSVVQINDNASVSGIARVEKNTAWLDNWYEYTYWSSPVSDATIGNALFESDPDRRFWFSAIDFVDSDGETNNDGVSTGVPDDIDDDGNDWRLANGTDVMTPGIGYAATHSAEYFTGPPPGTPPIQFLYYFDGTLNNGEISVPIARNDTEMADTNWNFIGNPYPSAIDVEAFFDENINARNPLGKLDGVIYLWSQDSPPSDTNNGNQSQNFSTADYAIINLVEELPGGDNNDDGVIDPLDAPARYIPSGQGFFVAYLNSAGGPTGNVIFNNSMRVTGNNNQFFRTAQNEEQNKLRLSLTSENGSASITSICYDERATDQFDGFGFDSPRNLASGSAAILYSVIEDNYKKFAIQSRDLNSMNTNDVVPIGFKTTIVTETEFTISISSLVGNFMNSNTIYLRDNLLNIEHNLSESNYTFTSDAGEYNSRLEIFFSGTLSINDLNLGSEELVISNSGENNIEISTKGHSQISNVKIYDLLGRELFDVEGNNNSLVNFNTSSLSNSVFILNVTTADRKKLTKKFLNN